LLPPGALSILSYNDFVARDEVGLKALKRGICPVKTFNTIFRPPSKYDKNIPYAYEARYCTVSGPDEYNSYFSDTVCGLIRYLNLTGFNPGTVELFELYENRIVRILPNLYSRDGNNWLHGNELCQSFRILYPDHIRDENCEFSDRSMVVSS
jgi:hypothetical protein